MISCKNDSYNDGFPTIAFEDYLRVGTWSGHVAWCQLTMPVSVLELTGRKSIRMNSTQIGPVAK